MQLASKISFLQKMPRWQIRPLIGPLRKRRVEVSCWLPCVQKLQRCPITRARLRLDGLRDRIPIYGLLPVVRLVRHVATERRVVTEHRVLQHGFTRSNGLKEFPKMRTKIVIVVPLESQ